MLSMTNKDLLSYTISYLRFPLTVGVVFIHFSLDGGINVHGVKYGLDNPEWYFFIINFTSQVLAAIGVPLFFFISGYLFFYNKDFNKDVYTQQLKKRANTLLVPYILWNLIAVLWHFKYFIPGISSFFRPTDVQISFTRILNTFFDNNNGRGIFIGQVSPSAERMISPIDGPLWFVRDLMLMVLGSPIIYWLTKKFKTYFVTVVGLVWLFSSFILPAFNYKDQLLTALFFFSGGGYYSINKENFVLSFRELKFIPITYSIIAVVDALSKSLVYNEYIHKIGIIFGIVTVIVIASYSLEHGIVQVNKSLADSSFFIYAMHYIFSGELLKFSFMMLHVPDKNPCAMLALYFSLPIISIFVCLGLFLFLKRYSPRLCGLLTGNRF